PPPYSPSFYRAKQDDKWDKINNLINIQDVKESLKKYRDNRAQLETIKEHGFALNTDYEKILTALKENKLVLDEGRKIYQDLKSMFKEGSNLSKQLTEAIEVLSNLNKDIIKTFMYSKDLTEEHKALLRAVNNNMITLFYDAQNILSDLDLQKVYQSPEKFEEKIQKASTFLTHLPTKVSQCFDKSHYDALDDAGLDLMDKAYNMVREAIEELFKKWDIKFEWGQRAVGKVTQDYKARINAITDQFKKPDESITLEPLKNN
ncbi:hypothetical protein, partial [Legionella qingyii]